MRKIWIIYLLFFLFFFSLDFVVEKFPNKLVSSIVGSYGQLWVSISLYQFDSDHHYYVLFNSLYIPYTKPSGGALDLFVLQFVN